MINIKVLGPGCTKCTKLAQNAEDAAAELGIEYHLEKVNDITEIMKYGVMMTPAFVVNEKVQSVGKLLSPEEIKSYLK